MPPGKINVTDLDSRNVKTPRSYTQGYNAQAAVNEHQIVLAAEVTLTSPDFGQLEPMIKATRRELEQIGVSEAPGVALADSGYWHEQQMDRVVNIGTQVLIPPDAGKHDTPRRGWDGGRYAFMRTVLAGDHGGGLTENARRWSSPFSLKPSTTSTSTSSNGEADPPTLGMAANHRDTQPAQAPQAPHGRPGRLKRHPGRTDTPPSPQNPIPTAGPNSGGQATPPVLHHPARTVGLISLVRGALDSEFLLQSAF